MLSRNANLAIILLLCVNLALLCHLLILKKYDGGRISKLQETMMVLSFRNKNLNAVNEQLQIFKRASTNKSEYCKQLKAENTRLKFVVVEKLRLMDDRRRELANKSEQYKQLEVDYTRLKRKEGEKLQLLENKSLQLEQLEAEIKSLKKSGNKKLQLLEEQRKGNENKSRQYKQIEAENKQLKRTLDELKRKMDNLTRSELRGKQSFMTFDLARPQENSNTSLKLIKDFTDKVTVILNSNDSHYSLECIRAKQKSIQKKFPGLKVIAPEKMQLSSASVFNFYFSLVKTKYFLFLDSSLELAEPRSDHSVSWLLYALENIPELDFISGSILKADRHLEVPCYRLLLCNWTLSQRYEYKRSVGEVMICENIAPSFMGKTSSVQVLFGENNSPFDSNLPVMSTTDFFLRVKQKGGTAGVLPEVMYTESQAGCHTHHSRNDKERFKALLPFAEKHKVFRFKDADSKVFDLCTNDSPLAGESICDEEIAHKVMLAGGHWVNKGTFAYPYMLNNLRYGLATVLKCLESENITFAVVGGSRIGALKFRGILPWDAGDVDIHIYDKNRTELYDIVKTYFSSNSGYTISMHPSSDQVQVFCTPAKIGRKMGGLVSLFPLHEPAPDPTEFIKMKANGKWIPTNKSVFKRLRTEYGMNYLQHRTWISNKVARCTLPGHNACLPNFQTLEGLQGTAGTFKEYFCDL